MNTLLLILADATSGAATGGAPAAGGQPQGPVSACGGGGGMQSMIFMVLMFAVFYFILIRPQQKRAKELQNMINQLKKGDSVVTSGGLIGTVTGIVENIVTLELQEKVRVRVLKSAIQGKHVSASPAPARDGKAAKESKGTKDSLREVKDDEPVAAAASDKN